MTTWPPTNTTPIWNHYTHLHNWWTNNPPTPKPTTTNHPTQYNGGLTGLAARTLWGKPNPNPNPTHHTHTPLASDITRYAADILYNTPPTITTPTTPTQTTTNTHTNTLTTTLTQGAEISSAYGHRYHRINHTPHGTTITTHTPLETIPTYTYGTLTQLDIITTLTTTNTTTIHRHIERHTLQDNGIGTIQHMLYEGTFSDLGHLVPLTDREETAGLDVDENGFWRDPHPTPGMYVVEVPNLLPQRLWRHHPWGRFMGRSDLEPVLSLLPALDEAWTSWMRDLRLGKARLIVARNALEDGINGRPLVHYEDQEAFVGLDFLDQGDGMPVQMTQFQLRVTEHAETVRALTEEIVRGAGFSVSSYTESTSGVMTATEIAAREQRTSATRARKITNETKAIRQLVAKLCAMDGHIIAPEDITVEWPARTIAQPIDQSSAFASLRAAEAASRETIVGMLHPQWGAEQIQAEVARIQAEHATITSPDQWRPTGDQQ